MKSTVNEVFKLTCILDDPRFEGFGLGELPSLLGRKSRTEDLIPGFGEASKNINWQQPRLAPVWTPPKVEGRVSEFNDYPCISLLFPAFSERAVDALGAMLTSNGELLPLDSKTKTRFFFFNILTISDALDSKRSKCSFWCKPPTTATSIDHFQFNEKKLADLTIFRIRESPSEAFVTNEFVDKVNFFGLKGFSFTKVWPLARGVNWRMQAPLAEQKDHKKLKKQSLIVILPFDGSAKQKKRISTFEDQCDVQLRVEDLNHPYFGAYEGHDQTEGEYRLFFSAPDAKKLFELLHDNIKKLSWPAPIKVCRRNGRIYDEKAKEDLIEI